MFLSSSAADVNGSPGRTPDGNKRDGDGSMLLLGHGDISTGRPEETKHWGSEAGSARGSPLSGATPACPAPSSARTRTPWPPGPAGRS